MEPGNDSFSWASGYLDTQYSLAKYAAELYMYIKFKRQGAGLVMKKEQCSNKMLSLLNPNSLDNKGSWMILKDFYCSVTMLRELGLM